jgi:hypothetical protein
VLLATHSGVTSPPGRRLIRSTRTSRTPSPCGMRHALRVCADGQLAEDPVTYRPASQADVPDLVELTTAFYQEDGFATVHEALPGRFTAFLGQSEANITVAVTGNATIGFALTRCV